MKKQKPASRRTKSTAPKPADRKAKPDMAGGMGYGKKKK